MLDKTMYVNTSFTVPALTKYTISYNANGGSGAPSSQTKYYGKDLALSSTTPTRTGYSFKGWALDKDDADAGYVYYQGPGSTCTLNQNLTLYAVWKANTYDVTFNANGGSSAPAKQTKTYGVPLTLSSTKPTRANYNFLGWATSASATTATYKAGGNYTANSDATLYAVWELAYVKPTVKIESLELLRDADTSEVYACYMGLSWACMDGYVPELMTVSYTSQYDSDSIDYSAVDLDGGQFTQTGNDHLTIIHAFDPEATYTFTLTVTDSVGSNSAVKTLSSVPYTIDCLKGGKGVAFGKSAELTGVADIGFQTRLLGGLMYVLLEAETDLNECHTPGFYMGENVSTYNYANCPLTSGTFTLEILAMGDNGQLMQRLTQCHISSPVVFERTYYKSAGWGEWFGGWIKPAIGSEFAVYASDGVSSTPACRKDGRIVEVRGIVKPAVDIPGGTDMHTIFTLPVGYRPSSPIYTVCQGSGNSTWLLRVNTSGTVDFSRYRNGDATLTASAGAWLPFQVTFIV
jgi:uncharacterized repeat protein (TIGR02543 family)